MSVILIISDISITLLQKHNSRKEKEGKQERFFFLGIFFLFM